MVALFSAFAARITSCSSSLPPRPLFGDAVRAVLGQVERDGLVLLIHAAEEMHGEVASLVDAEFLAATEAVVLGLDVVRRAAVCAIESDRHVALL